jgi:FlaA1/EpsC-like NDP-sugar epimerase
MNLNNKKIFITGGTGSWGQELVSQLLTKYNVQSIIVYSRNENAQVLMKRKFNDPKIKYIIGDVRNYNSLLRACSGSDVIFHLAALKHVPIGEEMPDEFISTNVLGTQNVRDAALANQVKKVILISTDKACSPINLYGYTKSLAEKIIIQANCLSEKTRFVCIRGGNALGSNGSIVPFFIQQIKTNNNLTITDSRMTRFFLTLKEAVGLIFSATENSYGGETFVMKMPSFKITDIAEILKEVYGNSNTTTSIIGVKPGEKIHEVLISEHEAKLTYHFNDDYMFIMPQIKIDYINDINLQKYEKFAEEKFDSQKTHSIDKLRIFLKNGEFI